VPVDRHRVDTELGAEPAHAQRGEAALVDQAERDGQDALACQAHVYSVDYSVDCEGGTMASWAEIESADPDFAARVQSRFDAATNKVLATLRAGGAPRVSGTELKFEGGEVTLGMMGGSVKLRDVRRDPRVAVHCPTSEPESPEDWPGDAKLAGTLVEVDPPADSPFPDAGYFRLDITEVVLTRVGTPADHLVIETWHAGRGRQRRTRK
jgi:hypothetical protein